MHALVGHGCASLEPLLGVVCSSSRGWVEFGDAVRWICLFLGALNTALYLRAAIQAHRSPRPGVGLRLLGSCLASYYIATTEWDRMHDPVTLRLALGVLALLAFMCGGMAYQGERESDRETEIEARIRLLEQRGKP